MPPTEPSWEELTWSWAGSLRHRTSDQKLAPAAKAAWPYALLCASTYLNDQDVAHELMEQAVQKAGDYLSRHPDISVLKLAGQVRNGIRRRAGQIARKKGREISLGSLSDLQHLCAEASEVEQRAIAKELFSRLSPFAQSVLNRRWMGYRWREIATELEIDHTVVRRAYFRELKSLLRSVSPSGESPR
jgi:DNA-directed RNA polymerase specialized sigma24 family protein